jgi:hypothetical protein
MRLKAGVGWAEVIGRGADGSPQLRRHGGRDCGVPDAGAGAEEAPRPRLDLVVTPYVDDGKGAEEGLHEPDKGVPALLVDASCAGAGAVGVGLGVAGLVGVGVREVAGENDDIGRKIVPTGCCSASRSVACDRILLAVITDKSHALCQKLQRVHSARRSEFDVRLLRCAIGIREQIRNCKHASRLRCPRLLTENKV